MKWKKLLAVLALSAVTAGLLAGCGGSPCRLGQSPEIPQDAHSYVRSF